MDELEVLAVTLDKLRVDPEARLGYDLFAGGLVWSDETPAWKLDGLENGQFPAGFGEFRALLNFRSSLILGNPREQLRELWDKANELCPNWPGFLPSRRDAALAETCRQRAEASCRSWEELNARYEQRRRAGTSKATT